MTMHPRFLFPSLILALLLVSPTLHAEVKHGRELKKAVNCGIPEGTALQESSEKVIKDAGEFTGLIFGAVKTTHEDGVVRFVKCKFVNPGYVSSASGPDEATPGTEFYTVHRAGKGSVELVDCEVYGGKSVAVHQVDKVTRTYITEGNDLLRAPAGDSFYTEVLAEKILMSSPESHSDVMQVTFNKNTTETPIVAHINVLRCWFDPRNFINDAGEAGQTGNGAIQLGSFKEGTGVRGQITDCYFDGGAFTLSGGGRGEAGEPIVIRGNKFGRSCLYGAFNPNWRENHDVDDTNVWEDNGTPAKGKPRA